MYKAQLNYVKNPPLHNLFSMCIQQCNIPSNWKIRCISVYKSSDKSSVSNYCPISLFSCTSKVLGRLIFGHTIDFLTHSILSNNQFGFLKTAPQSNSSLSSFKISTPPVQPQMSSTLTLRRLLIMCLTQNFY